MRQILSITVEKGKVNLTNVPFNYAGSKQSFASGTMTIKGSAVELPVSSIRNDNGWKPSIPTRRRNGSKRRGSSRIPSMSAKSRWRPSSCSLPR